MVAVVWSVDVRIQGPEQNTRLLQETGAIRKDEHLMRRLFLVAAAALILAGLILGDLAIANYSRYSSMNSLGESQLAKAQNAIDQGDEAAANRYLDYAESDFEDARLARAGTGILTIISLVSLSGGSALLWSQMRRRKRQVAT